MAQQKLVIWGASGHALVVVDIVRLRGEYEIVGFLDDVNPERRNTEFCGATILGGAEQLSDLRRAGVSNIIFGFGDCQARLRLAEVVRGEGFSLITVIHPQAVVAAEVRIGEGTVVVAGAVINPAARIGNNAIINTCASIDHECLVEDGVHICPGVHLGGRVTVGRGAWVGIGSTVTDRVHIGEYSVVGAGSLVLNDVPPGVVVYGVPARIQREGVNLGEH